MPKRPRRKTTARARTNPSRSNPRARRPAPALPEPGALAARLCIAGPSVSADEFLFTLAEGLAEALEARGIVIAEIAENGREMRGIVTVIRGRREEPFAIELEGTPFAPIVRGESDWIECRGREAETLEAETLFPGSASRIVALALHSPGAVLPGLVALLDPPAAHPAPALLPALAPVLERLAAELALRRAEARLAAVATAAPEAENRRIEELERRVVALQARNHELAAARDALQSSDHTRTQFLAGVGTSMRTPLNSVLGSLQLLVDTPLDSEQRELVGNGLAACESLVSGVNEVLDFASSDSGPLLLEPAPFDLRAAVENVVDAFSSSASRRGIELVLQMSPEVPAQLVGDPVRIRQLVTGLVENAVTFTAQGHVLVTVDAPRKEARDVRVRVTVEDTGPGIEPARLATLFERASGAPRRTGSTGAPLPMLRRLAEAMDGTLLATSSPGEGSTFTATMTLGAGHAAKAAETAPLESVRALVVDDVEIHRMVLRRQMTALGMRVETAPDGRTALAMLLGAAETDDPFRLALIDNRMPGMTGEELGRALRADARTATLALMMFTASGDRDEARRFARAGFDGYFLKPILPSILQEAFVKVLAVRGGAARDSSIVTRREVGRAAVPAAVVAPPPAPAGLDPGATPAAPDGKPRVLVAEDDPTNQLVAVRLLERLGFVVDRAADGREAVELWRRNEYAVVFMDCLMPEMSGYEATMRIRSEEADGRHTPIVALTASVLPSDRERCRQSGMDAFLAKPVREASLRMVVQRALDPLEADASPIA